MEASSFSALGSASQLAENQESSEERTLMTDSGMPTFSALVVCRGIAKKRAAGEETGRDDEDEEEDEEEEDEGPL